MYRENRFGTGWDIPLTKRTPKGALDELREELQTGHTRYEGVFTIQARAYLAQSIWAALFAIETEEMHFFDTMDPQATPGERCPDHNHVLVVNADGWRLPWSLSENQKRGEQARLAQGKHWRKQPKGRICGKMIKRGQRYYVCKTCTREATILMCPECFNASNHEGHEVSFAESKHFTIACLCGNDMGFHLPETAGCRHHPPDLGAHIGRPPSFRQPLPEAIRFESLRAAAESKQLPHHLQQIHEVLQILVDYVLMVLTCSLPYKEYKLPDTKEEFHKSYAPFSNVSPSQWSKGPWAVTVLSDERHSVSEVVKQCVHALGINEASAEAWTKETEEVGRKTAIVTPKQIAAYHAASMFQRIEMPVSIRHAYDTYMEEAVGVILTMLADICDSHLNGDPDMFSMLLGTVLAQPRPVEGSARVPADIKFRASPYSREPFFRPLKVDWLYMLDGRLWKMARLHIRQIYARIYTSNPGVQDLLVDRFARSYVRLTEMTLTDDRETEMLILGGLTATILSRGHPLTIATGTRLRNPTDSPNRILHDLISIIQVWYTDTMDAGRLKLPLADPDRLAPYNHDEFDRIAFSRTRRAGYLLNQIRNLLSHDEVGFSVKDDALLFPRIITMLSTFVGLSTQYHALGSHIKYEADYARGFTLLSDISHVGKELGNCFLRFPTPGSVATAAPFDQIRQVMRRICADTQLETEVLDKRKYTLPVTHIQKGVLLPHSEVTTYNLQVWGIKAFSFHHYLHYLLGELTKTLFTLPHHNSDSLRTLFKRHVFDHKKLDQDVQMLLIIDQTLTTFAVLGHIRAGLWSRNGMSVRNQMAAYRDLSFRECANDLEFVLLQLALCTMEPIHFMTALIDRFGFASAFSGDGRQPHAAPDWAIKASEAVTMSELAALLEDLVWLVISLVSDIDAITDKSPDDITRRTIIQTLAIGPLSLYDLQRRLPERGLEESNYMAMLAELADYRGPVESSPGYFSLKKEYYSKVDPLYRHYNRNERASVHKMLLDELRKQHPDDPDVSITPLPLDVPALESGKPISALRNVLRGPVAQRLVHYLIGHCIHLTMGRAQPSDLPNPSPARASELLEATLWLAMLALDNEPTFFAKASVDPASVQMHAPEKPTLFQRLDTPNTLFENLELMQVVHDTMFHAHMPSINYVVNKIIQHAPSQITETYLYRLEARKARKEPKVRRPGPPALTGAARQKQLMAEFAQKQSAFAAAMDEEEEEDDAMDEDTEDDPSNISYGNCIVCQDPVTQASPGGALSLFQPSRMVRDWLLEKEYYELALTTPSNLDTDTREIQYSNEFRDRSNVTDAYPTQHNRFGAFTSACGHLMHDSCMKSYFEQTRNRHLNQVHRNQPENAARNEYLCPLCKSIGNFLLPLAEPSVDLPDLRTKYVEGQPPALKERIRTVSGEMLMHVNDSTKIWEHHEDGGQLSPWYADTNFNVETLDRFHRKTTIRPVAEMVENFRAIFKLLSEQSATKYRSGKQRTAMYIPEDMIGYTVACNEVALRCVPRLGDQSTVAEQLTSIQVGLIKNLVNYLRIELDVYYGPNRDRTTLRVALFTRFLPDYYRAPPLTIPLLLREPLTFVIEAAALAPDLLHSVMVMSFFAEVTRAIISLSLFIRRSVGIWDNARSQRLNALVENDQTCPEDAMSVFEGFRPVMANIIQNTGPYGVGDENVLRHVSDKVIAKLMYMCTLPILRRFAIVYHAVTGSYPITDPTVIKTSGNEYDRLLSVLGIPRPTETMLNNKSDIHPLVMRWVSLWVQHGRVITNLEWPGTYELMKLPRMMDDLVWKHETHRCVKCRSIPNYPAMCLYCGKYLCLAGDCCSEGELGECNLHMRNCGTATGMFVDIRRWSLLLLYAGNGSYVPMPYVDQYGDGDHRRNVRLQLDPRRFEEVRKTIWLNHGIPHAIARRLEGLNDLGGWGCL